ncbi:peptidase inhibitor family I36 protein [Streptomyces purpurascens]|uniref:peptidase inhibitor family I36 protein n=1 Tax=Streptomyces purpurascens TaxID=1924 RepID=UPI0033F8BEF7
MKRSVERSLVTAVAVIGLGAMGGITPVGAEEVSSTQQKINEVLAATKGGAQISPYEIAWNNGGAIMAFPLPGEFSAPAPSDAAQKLQAGVVEVPSSTRESAPEMQPPTARDLRTLQDDPVADEPPSSDEKEPDVDIEAADKCPTQIFGNDWYCFYQYKNFGGRRLQWNESHPWGDRIYFSEYNFENKTSSYSNKGGKNITVRGRTVTGSDRSCTRYLWEIEPHYRSKEVPYDNQADCFSTT